MKRARNLAAIAGFLLPLSKLAFCQGALPLGLNGPGARGQGFTNLVSNGAFAQVAEGRPRDWETAGDTAIVTQELRVTTDSSGKRRRALKQDRKMNTMTST